MVQYALKNIVDLTNPQTLARLGVTKDDIHAPWLGVPNPPTWELVDKLQAKNIAGVKYPSAVCAGYNIALWVWDEKIVPVQMNAEKANKLSILAAENDNHKV